MTALKTLPKAALIDMDGTLYDSMGNHADAWLRVATEAGIKATREEFYAYEGQTGAATIDLLIRREFGRAATDDEKRELYRKKTVYFQQLPPVQPMAGALQMLQTLKEAGIMRVLVTGSGQNSLLSRINTDFPGMFSDDLRITSANVVHGKPDPEPYLKAMEMAAVEPHEAIAIENAPLGVLSAHRSRAFTVGVNTGPIPREELEKAGADIVYNSMQQFADDLPRLLQEV